MSRGRDSLAFMVAKPLAVGLKGDCDSDSEAIVPNLSLGDVGIFVEVSREKIATAGQRQPSRFRLMMLTPPVDAARYARL